MFRGGSTTSAAAHAVEAAGDVSRSVRRASVGWTRAGRAQCVGGVPDTYTRRVRILRAWREVSGGFMQSLTYMSYAQREG